MNSGSGGACAAALEAIRRVEQGDMRLWQGRRDLLWLRYLWATRENDYNRARVLSLGDVAPRESLCYTRRTLEHLAAAEGDWTPEERDAAALALCWAESAKGGMPRERESWKARGISLLDHAGGSAALYRESLTGEPGSRELAVSLLIEMHGALGQYLQGEIAPESGTFPLASPRRREELAAFCREGGVPFPFFCRALALVSECVLAGVSPRLPALHRRALAGVAAGELLEPLSPARRAARLCGGQGEVTLSPRAEELLAGRDLWYGDGALRAMGPLRGPAFLDALAASLPEVPLPPAGRGWRPGPMLTLASLQQRLYFYNSGARRTDHCVLAMAERAAEGGRFAPTDHLALSFSAAGEGRELALVAELTPMGEAIDQFYRTLVAGDITHNKAVLAVFDQLGYRPDIFARPGSEDQYLQTMNAAAGDKERLLAFLRDGDRVLDVGPGGGVLLDLVAGAFPRCSLAGADISAEVCRRLRSRVEAEKLPWQVIHSDFLALRQEEVGRFDAILFCSIIHEIFSYGEYRGRRFNKAVIPRILEVAAGLLEPGGRVIIRDGVADGRNPPVELRFWDRELEELARDYLGQFRGFPLEAQGPEETGRPHCYRMPQNSAMELLYTVTWGKESLPYEVEEWYGYYTEEEWRALGERLSAPGGPGLRLRYFTQYLQPGYVRHLEGRVSLTDPDGAPVPFPDSNMIAVFQKDG